MDGFTYMNEANIDDDIKCPICKKPFTDPVYFPHPCEQTYCFKCIKDNIQNHSNGCSECNGRSLSASDLLKEGPSTRRILNNLLVKCDRCSKTNIKRSKIFQHFGQECSKRIVNCSANDIQCPWSGPFDEAKLHVRSCSYEILRTLLTEFLGDVEQLKKLKIDFQNLNNEFQQCRNQIQQVEAEKQDLIEKLKEIDELKVQNQTIQDQYDQDKTAKNNLETDFNKLKDELEVKVQSTEKLEKEIEVLQENLKALSLVQEENQQFKDSCQQQRMEIDSLVQDREGLQQQINGYKKEFTHLHEALEQFQNDREKLQQHCQYYETRINQYIQENGSLLHRISLLEDLIKHVNLSLDQSQKNNAQLTQQSLQDRMHIEQLVIDLKRLETKLYQPINQTHKRPVKTDDNRNQLQEFIEKCQSSCLVNLNGEKIDDHNIDIVIDAAIINKQCQSLILWNNGITTHSISRLASTLKIITTLQKLSISNNYLSDTSMRHLSESLSYNASTLKVLVLSSNDITDQGLIYLSDMLKTNNILTVLGLQDNKITDKSTQYLCQAIQSYNNTIQEVSLYSNKSITDESINHIINMITNNQSLETFWIWDCQLSEKGKSKLQASIQSKTNFNLLL